MTKDDIIRTQDDEYICNCIINSKDLGLEKEDVLELIKCINSENIEIIDRIIRKRNELELDQRDICDLVLNTGNIEYIDKFVKEAYECGYTGEDLVKIISRTENDEYIDKCVRNRDELDLSHYNMMTLINSIQDIAYKDSYIYNREEFELDNYDVYQIIVNTCDLKYIDKCIHDSRKIGLSQADIINIISDTHDIDYIDSCIRRREEFGLGIQGIISLIKRTKNLEYIDKCINDSERLNLNNENIVEIITSTKDMEYICKCINNSSKLGLNKNDITEIIDTVIRTGSSENIHHIVEIAKKNKVLDPEFEKLQVLFDEKYLDSLMDNNNKTRINLPQEMTIGMEIESIGKNSKYIRKVGVGDYWESKEDGSLKTENEGESGIEVVSPILTGDNDIITHRIKKVCAKLQVLGQYANETCGGHIHIGANYLDNIKAWQNLVEIWANTESILYIISNKKGEISRNGVPKYATPISGDLEEQINTGSINLKDESDLFEFKRQLWKSQNNRYKGINFHNLVLGDKDTVEFRLPNGTVDSITWIENINLFGGIMRAAHDLSIIQKKDAEERTDVEKHQLECFENIKNKELEEREVLKQLLELVVSAEDRKIYIDRYDVNKELLKNNPEIDNGIRNNTAKNSVLLSKSKIAKELYTKEDRITGEEQELINYIIEKYLVTDEYNQEINSINNYIQNRLFNER